MHLVLRNIKLQKTKYGHDIVIKMVRQFDDNGEFVKNLPLDEDTVKRLLENKLVISKKVRKRIKTTKKLKR